MSFTFQDVLKKRSNYAVAHRDCIEEMHSMPESSVDFTIFSPPFMSVFAYSDSPSDLGNSDDLIGESKLHFSYFFRGLHRVLKPGRVAIVHCMQIPRLKRAGEEGLFDFRGMLIRLGERAGLVYEYDYMVRRNPQAQAIRTKKIELKFQGIETDRAVSRGTLCDYCIKFRKPGENKKKINTPGEVSRETWIKWAEGCWTDIIETDTLNVKASKGEDDVKHICPLQLGLIYRFILLYSDPGEIVFSPFAGIGSEGYVALGGKSPKTKLRIKHPRRFYGCEIKDEYYNEALVNLKKADSPDPLPQKSLLEELGDEEDYSLPSEESSGCAMPFTVGNPEDNEE